MKAKLMLRTLVFLIITVLLYLAPSQASAYILWDGKWTTPGPEPGSTQVTYSFINYTPDITVSAQRSTIESAFQLWADVAPLWFEEVIDTGLPFQDPGATAPNAGDIRILFGTGEHGDGWDFDGTGNSYAHAWYPPPNWPSPGTGDGDAHFDEDETWTDQFRAGGGQPIDLLTLAGHEFGHSLGLLHNDIDTTALMYPYYNGSHRYLADDDIAGIQAQYGSGTGAVIPIPEPYTLLLLASGLAAMGERVRRRLRR